MRPVTPLVMALMGLALTVPVVAMADHRPGHGTPGPDAATLTLSASSTAVTFGRSTTLSGDLRGSDRVGKVVELEEDQFPFADSGFRSVATAVTNDKGSYSFNRVPVRHTRYRVVAKTSPPATSSPVTVTVRLRVGIRLSDSTPRRGQLVRFSGSVAPEHDGRSVLIQRRTSSGSYRTVARTRLVDAGTTRSIYGRRVRLYRDGVYRTRVSGDTDHSTGTSRLRTVDVH